MEFMFSRMQVSDLLLSNEDSNGECLLHCNHDCIHLDVFQNTSFMIYCYLLKIAIKKQTNKQKTNKQINNKQTRKKTLQCGNYDLK